MDRRVLNPARYPGRFVGLAPSPMPSTLPDARAEVIFLIQSN